MFADRDYMNSGRSGSFAQASAVKTLIYANIAVFILSFMLQLLPDLPFVLSSDGIRRGQFWRLFTYMFFHAGFMHLAFNMFALYVFGSELEQRLGKNRFLQLYFISGLTGALLWLLFNWRMPTYVLGASGAVFGVMMAAALTFPNRIIVLLFPPIPMRLKTLVAVFALIEVFMLLGSRDQGIAHLAHLGGLLGGFLCMHHYFHRRGGAGSDSAIGRLRSWWSHRQAAQRRRRFTIDRDQQADDDPSPADSSHFNAPVSDEVDRILDKIGRYGIHSLNGHEREVLEEARQRLRDRRRL